MVCPEGTFGLSGDTSCSRCPFGQYAPQGAATCFPQDRLGGIVRIDVPFNEAVEQEIVRTFANLLEAEMSWFRVHLMRSGSTVLYLSIDDPPAEVLVQDDSDLRRLSGNERMLYLYQMWNFEDSRLKLLPFDILDIKEFAFSPGVDGLPGQTVLLFGPQKQPEEIIPPQPFFVTSKGGITVRSLVRDRNNTLVFDLQVGSAAPRMIEIVLLLALSLAACMFA